MICLVFQCLVSIYREETSEGKGGHLEASGGFITIIQMMERNDNMEVVDVEVGDKHIFRIYFLTIGSTILSRLGFSYI